mmetsp:Transcript_60413/g.129538  ORF Transcript_60413/g.129538 Transcript_60413/m.129538 type:complete len:283 (-) Transcript_60413:19-867(-)
MRTHSDTGARQIGQRLVAGDTAPTSFTAAQSSQQVRWPHGNAAQEATSCMQMTHSPCSSCKAAISPLAFSSSCCNVVLRCRRSRIPLVRCVKAAITPLALSSSCCNAALLRCKSRTSLVRCANTDSVSQQRALRTWQSFSRIARIALRSSKSVEFSPILPAIDSVMSASQAIVRDPSTRRPLCSCPFHTMLRASTCSVLCTSAKSACVDSSSPASSGSCSSASSSPEVSSRKSSKVAGGVGVRGAGWKADRRMSKTPALLMRRSRRLSCIPYAAIAMALMPS